MHGCVPETFSSFFGTATFMVNGPSDIYGDAFEDSSKMTSDGETGAKITDGYQEAWAYYTGSHSLHPFLSRLNSRCRF